MEETKHAHAVTDQDLPFVIDPITKEVSSQGGSLVVPQHAKNSERFTFTIPDRRIEGHDMSEVNQAFVHFRNIGTKGEMSAGIYKVEDLAVADDSVTLSWLIDNDATYYVGALIFSIHFICTDEAGEVVYDLPTLAYSKITVGETVWNSEETAKKYPDIIAELEARVSTLEAGSTVVNAVLYTPQALTETQQLQAKANLGLAQLIACRYNGVELPPLPVEEDYQYATIDKYYIDVLGIDEYRLCMHNGVKYGTNGDRVSFEVPHVLYKCASEDSTWTLTGKQGISFGLEGKYRSSFLWTNVDIVCPDGAFSLAASEPVPIYAESGGSAGAGVEVFDLADYDISMLSILMSGNVKTEQDCTNLVTAVTDALVAGKVPVLFDGMAGVYAFVNAVVPGVQIGGALFGDFGTYIIKADVVIATDAIYLYTSELPKE